MDKKWKYKIKKSEFPDADGTHLVVMYGFNEYGSFSQRIFKGSYEECLEKKKELEGENEPEAKDS